MLARLELFGRWIQLSTGRQQPPPRPDLHLGATPPLRTAAGTQWRLGFHIQPRLQRPPHDTDERPTHTHITD